VVDFNILNSKYFGVPQNRERIFIVAIREDLIEAEPFSEEATKGNTIVPKGKRRIGDWAKTFNFDWPENNEVITKLQDILESVVDEKYYLDNYKTMELIKQIDDNDLHVIGNLEGGPWDNRYEAIRRVYDGVGVSPTVTAGGGGGVEPKIAERRTCNDDTKGFDGVRLYDDETPSLRSSRSGLKVAEPKYRIRNLTPRECWRLQGFPDVAHDAVESAGISDSQRYKQAGNAVTVNVIEAIGERLIPLIVDETQTPAHR